MDQREQEKPEGKYGVILADPPWSYANAGCRGAAGNHYQTMTMKDICALPVQDWAASDSVLLLWATWPQLREGLEVIASWGFEYITGFPWLKMAGEPSVNRWGEWEVRPQYGVGFWIRGCTEPLLIARRGSVSPPTDGLIGLLSENYRHSRKPDNVYHYAETLPGPYLELFARRKRLGWSGWGNELHGDQGQQQPTIFDLVNAELTTTHTG